MNTNIDNTAHVKGRCEGEHLWKDFSPVPGIVSDFAFNVLNPLGLLYRPVVDEDYLARGGPRPVRPDGKPFAMCLTHDVDQARRALLSFDNLFLICKAKSCRKKYQERRSDRCLECKA